MELMSFLMLKGLNNETYWFSEKRNQPQRFMTPIIYSRSKIFNKMDDKAWVIKAKEDCIFLCDY